MPSMPFFGKSSSQCESPQYHNVQANSDSPPPMAYAVAMANGNCSPTNSSSSSSTPVVIASEVPSSPLAPQTHVKEEDIIYELGRYPVRMTCPCCGKDSVTRTKTYPNWKTWVTTGGLCCVAWPFFWVPLVGECMKQTDHICQRCGQTVGSVDAFADCCVSERNRGGGNEIPTYRF